MSLFPIAGELLRINVLGQRFSLDVLDPAGIAEELEHYPGIVARRDRYLPIAGCMSGSGDPFCIKVTSGDDPPLIQIFHDTVVDGEPIKPSDMQEICPSLSYLFRHASGR